MGNKEFRWGSIFGIPAKLRKGKKGVKA
jgi:hypothetical protein